MHFFYFFCIFLPQIFGHVKKKQYLCTRFRKESTFLTKRGAVVQLVRISACHAGGREFESRRHRRKVLKNSRLFLFQKG